MADGQSVLTTAHSLARYLLSGGIYQADSGIRDVLNGCDMKDLTTLTRSDH